MKKILSIFVLAALLLGLGGCYLKTGDELYSLPKPPEDYVDLQSWIDILLQRGSEYSAPLSGASQQSVQLVDIDGDGVQEALAFMYLAGEKPLRIYIFRKNAKGAYDFVSEIEGEGAAFDSVEYTNLDGVGGSEIVVGRQMSDTVMQYLTVYSLDADYHVTELAAGACTEYKTSDLDGDGVSELVLMKLDSPEIAGTADYYDCVDGHLTMVNSVPLSLGMESIQRIKNGTIEENIPAMFLSGYYQSTGVVTDVLAVKDGELANITMPEGADTSLQTIRNYIIYPSDVDGDGVMELARPTQMQSVTENTEVYYTLDWYGQNLDGQWVKKLTTYHNYSEGWYFIIPESWEGKLSVVRTDSGDEGKSMTFYYCEDGRPPKALMIICTFTSDDREKLAARGQRFILYSKTDVIYAAEIAVNADSFEDMLTSEEVVANFRVIRSEWNTGET